MNNDINNKSNISNKARKHIQDGNYITQKRATNYIIIAKLFIAIQIHNIR